MTSRIENLSAEHDPSLVEVFREAALAGPSCGFDIDIQIGLGYVLENLKSRGHALNQHWLITIASEAELKAATEILYKDVQAAIFGGYHAAVTQAKSSRDGIFCLMAGGV